MVGKRVNEIVMVSRYGRRGSGQDGLEFMEAERLATWVEWNKPQAPVRDALRRHIRANWLVRQLKNAPESVRVQCFTARVSAADAAELL